MISPQHKTTLTSQIREAMQSLIANGGEVDAPQGHGGTIVSTVKRLADFDFNITKVEFYTRTRKKDGVLVIGIRNI